MSKLKLAQFNIQDFDRLINWIDTEKILIQFAGPIFSFPLTHVQLNDYILNPKLKPFKVLDALTDRVIGHCELNFTNPKIPRISRVLIGEESERGKGLGQALIYEAALRLFEDEQINQIDLNVFKWNQAAIRCYQKMGFEIGPNEPNGLHINGELWEGHNMILKRKDFENFSNAQS